MEESGTSEAFNPLEPFSFFLSLDEWMRLKPKESGQVFCDGRRCLQPGWSDLFESKLREVNHACIRWYTGSVKKASSRKQLAPFFTGRTYCRNPECTLTYKLTIAQEPCPSTKAVEVIVTPQGEFVPSDPLDVQDRPINRMRKREFVNLLEDESAPEPLDCVGEQVVLGYSNTSHGDTVECASIISKRYPPFVRYGKRHVGGSNNVMVGCGGGKTMEDLLYCSTLEADRAKLIAEKEKLQAEKIMLQAKTEELIAKKAKLETETNNLIMQRLKLKHELNSVGLDVEIVTDEESHTAARPDAGVDD